MWATARTSTDTTIDEDPFFGTYVGGYVRNHFGDFRLTVDGRFELLFDGGINNVYETGPLHTGVLGLHLGRNFGQTYVGAYGAIGWFDGYDSDSPMTGWTAGVEAEHALANGGAIYGQLGYVNAIGDPGDNEFIGPSLRFGLFQPISERLSADMAISMAYSSECFEDCGGDWGLYTEAALTLNYAISDRLDLVAGTSLAQIMANDEDSGMSANLYLGVQVALGDRSRNNLRTPMAGFNAAGWMHPLD